MTPHHRTPGGRRVRAAGAVLLAAALSGCAAVRAGEPRSAGTAAAPSSEWVPPRGSVAPAVPVNRSGLSLPQNFTPGMAITLPEVIDLALSNNTQTRIAWLGARSAQAALGSRESARFPGLDLSAQVSRGTLSGSPGTVQTTFGPSLALTWLLFDFGGREADIEQARQTLIAADFLHNQAIQDVILRTQQTYYSVLDAKALLAAQDATLKERQTALDAAGARHSAGVATIADVLQARTANSQALLNRESIEGSLRTLEGTLATLMGLPPGTRFDFGSLPLEVPAMEMSEAVDSMLARAVAERPDLAAARANAGRAQARVREVRVQGLPSISLSSSAGRTWTGSPSGGGFNTPYSAGVSLRWPVFTGFRNTFDLRQAEIDAQTAAESVRSLEQQVDLQVWTSYYALQTATRRLGTARDLLASAGQSVDVATNRYRAGVGSILDLLTAEAALESARAQEVQARTDWFLSVAQLARDTGSLQK